jgi:hypothetical protein
LRHKEAGEKVASKNVLTIAAKMVGGSKIKSEAKGIGGAARGMAEDFKKADTAAGSGRGLQLFTKHAKEAEGQARKSHHIISGLFTGAIGAIAGFTGIEGVKSLVNSTQELGEATERFHAVTGMSQSSSMQYVAALKARNVGASAGQTAFVQLARNVGAAEKQERKYGEAAKVSGAKAAAARTTERIADEKRQLALMKAEASGKSYAVMQAKLAISAANAARTGKNGTTATAEMGKQQAAFQRLGISLHALKDMTPEKQFSMIIGKLSNMKDGMEKTSLATAIFGRGGRALAPIMEKGALGLDHMLKVAQKFFPELKDGGKGLEELKSQQAESSLAWESVRYHLGTLLAPALNTTLKWFSKIGVSIQEGKGLWGELAKAISWTVGAFKTVIGFFNKNEAAAIGLKSALVLLAAAWAIQKIIKFYEALKKLWLLEKIAGLARGSWKKAGMRAAESGAEGVGSQLPLFEKNGEKLGGSAAKGMESSKVRGLFGKAGGLLGMAFGAAAAISIGAEIGKYVSEKFPNGFFGKPEVPNVHAQGVIAGLGKGTYLRKNLDDKLEVAPSKGFANTRLGGKAAAHGNKVHVFDRAIGQWVWVTPGETLPGPKKLWRGGILHTAGSVVVGDRGPEVLSLPAAARVDPLQGRGAKGVGGLLGAFRGGNDGDLHVHVEIARNEIAKAVLKEFRKLEARAS